MWSETALWDVIKRGEKNRMASKLNSSKLMRGLDPCTMGLQTAVCLKALFCHHFEQAPFSKAPLSTRGVEP